MVDVRWKSAVWIGCLGLAACGGDERTTEPPPPPAATTVAFDLAGGDPCAARVPVPTDLFVDVDLRSERSACASGASPVEAAIDAVLRNEGAPIERAISLSIADGQLAVPSLTSSVSLTLTSSGAGTSSTAAPPPIVLLEQVGTATATDGWAVRPVDALYTGDTLTVTPRTPLAHARRYVLVLTDRIKDTDGKPLGVPPAVAALLGDAPIAAEAFAGLDAASASRLERERQRLAPALAVLGAASPRVPAERIVSIQTWTTALGPRLLAEVAKAYTEALAAGRLPFAVTTMGGDLDPADVFPPGFPPDTYAEIRAFRRGTIRVPDALDESGRLRPGWAGRNPRTIEVPFLISLPRTARMRYPVTVLLPGWGRSKEDAVSIGNALAGGGQSAVLALDLPFHGARSTDPTDVASNNDNPEVSGADGIPDSSGAGFFSGDPGQLRDRQLGALIEIVHVLETLKQGDAFESEAISPDRRAANQHIVGHGHSAWLALAAATVSRVGTIQVPSGGIGVRDLVLEGPEALRTALLAGVPAGVDATNLETYLARAEETVLVGLDPEGMLDAVAEIYLTGPNPKVLLAHGGLPTAVPLAARDRLIMGLGLPSSRVSRHLGFCDDFFIHTCRQGENTAIVPRAREQLAAFVSSGGVTVRPPASDR